MRILTIALLSLSLPAAAGVVERSPAQMKRELAAHGCHEATRLPFPLPSADESEAWGDDDYEAWEAAQWDAYCAGNAKAHACRCESLRSGGRY